MSRRSILPVCLAFVGLLFLAGCIYIPTFGVSVHGTSNIARKVGDARSSKPIKLNVSTREDVERLFGRPDDATVDGTQTYYTWTRRWGFWFAPLCFWNELGYFSDDQSHYFLLTYNSDHILIKVELIDEWPLNGSSKEWESVARQRARLQH